eukprot:TRINITY_DN8205_c0_g1_i1.p2 TRINITY_DN8205_c0_g1~~TRINITY_DN8205_c0_g1_i1.p2  ORF type:complete len:174 (+),score=33.35 TRINITY_DN8205_c0_g1_i1:158-679(+)
MPRTHVWFAIVGIALCIFPEAFCGYPDIIPTGDDDEYHDPNMPVLSKSMEVKDNIQCEVCQAVVKELSAKAASVKMGKGREAKIMNIIEDGCAPMTYVKYEYSPPKMAEGCRVFMSKHDEALEKLLYKGESVDKILQTICIKTKTCARLTQDDPPAPQDGDSSIKVDPVHTEL